MKSLKQPWASEYQAFTEAANPSVGIKPGWILLEIAGQPTRSVADFQQAMAGVNLGDSVRFRYSLVGE
jgi:S1-C subfamily serine protease